MASQATEASTRSDGGVLRTQRELPSMRVGTRDGSRSMSANARWRSKNREDYNAYMKGYMARRRMKT